MVINPRNYTKHPEHNSLLQVLSYVSVAEINEMNLMNCQKGSFSEEGELAPNDVYVKLLNGFELHTNEGTLREKDIRSSQSVLFLTHLINDFSGIVLPNVDHRSLGHIDQLYEEKRKLAQLECISLMYDLGLYVRILQCYSTGRSAST